MKKFVTEDSFWQLFPGASLGVIVARGMKPANEISPEDAQAIEQLLTRANALAEKHLESPTLSENAPVRAWRQAYQQFKTKRGARIEQLLTRANALAEKHLESPTLSENAPVRAWRQAYQQFKTKRGARCSIENLLKRVLKALGIAHPLRERARSRLAPGLSAIQDQARRALLHREPAQARPQGQPRRQHLALGGPLQRDLPQIRPAAGRRGPRYL